MLTELQAQFQQHASTRGIKGTILLSSEGINLFLAGTATAMQEFMTYVVNVPAFSDLHIKRSESTHIPYQRLKVRIKPEIIFMNQPSIAPAQATAPHLEPEQLRNWCEQGHDMVLLDTRNDYEVAAGTFQHAIHLDIQQFSDFPAAVARLPDDMKNRPMVTFCTGGIRCEKAAAYLMQQGFNQVWQLHGGILHYFEQCGDAYFQGNCFVFDERVALDAQLQAVSTHSV